LDGNVGLDGADYTHDFLWHVGVSFGRLSVQSLVLQSLVKAYRHNVVAFLRLLLCIASTVIGRLVSQGLF